MKFVRIQMIKTRKFFFIFIFMSREGGNFFFFLSHINGTSFSRDVRTHGLNT